MIPIVFNERCLEFESPGHPESPERIKMVYDFLKEKDYEFVSCEPCGEEELKLCHSQNLIERVRQGNFHDPDTPNLPGIYEYARLSAGGALKALELLSSHPVTCSLMRPPGHHAGKSKLGGFCYFNNIAIAVRKSGMKSAIIDIDCHHGNGTQDIVLGDEKILYLSIHRNGFFYPGTGHKSTGNCLNYPLSQQSESEWMNTFGEVLEEVKDFSPELIAVSAGFDAYEGDPLAGFGLSEKIYSEIGQKIRNLSKPVLTIMEGGYSQKLPECVDNFLMGLSS